MERPVKLEVSGVHKAFGSTRALRGVSIRVEAGSVHAFIGENGAGKSTLGKIIAGVVPPDRGSLAIGGSRVAFASPRRALEHGIVLVAQELTLVPQLTVAENVFLGAEPARAGFIDRRGLRARYEALAAEAGFPLRADDRVGRLAVGQQQQVEILRALAREVDLIVFDEPTASLSRDEAEHVYRVIRTLAGSGKTVILVSHFLPEVLELADAVTVLRDGAVVRTGPTVGETESSLIQSMLGRTLGQVFPAKQPPAEDAKVALEVDRLLAPGVDGATLSLRAGEIVGLAGLVGAGRSELASAIFGAAAVRAGQVLVGGQGVSGGPASFLRHGVAFIPASRKDDGLMLGRPVRENVSLPGLRALSRFGFVRRRTEGRRVGKALAMVHGTRALEAPAEALSGGNQQKLLFARAVLGRPAVLIADEPTRGVDVGAKREIYEHIAALAAQGVAVLLISSELEEILGLSHRVLVMRRGRIVADLRDDAMTETAILNAAFGAQAAA